MYVFITLTHTNYMKNSKEKRINEDTEKYFNTFSGSLENKRKEEDPPSYIPSNSDEIYGLSRRSSSKE